MPDVAQETFIALIVAMCRVRGDQSVLYVEYKIANQHGENHLSHKGGVRDR